MKGVRRKLPDKSLVSCFFWKYSCTKHSPYRTPIPGKDTPTTTEPVLRMFGVGLHSTWHRQRHQLVTCVPACTNKTVEQHHVSADRKYSWLSIYKRYMKSWKPFCPVATYWHLDHARESGSLAWDNGYVCACNNVSMLDPVYCLPGHVACGCARVCVGRAWEGV